jgi:3-dehydroquinate synthase
MKVVFQRNHAPTFYSLSPNFKGEKGANEKIVPKNFVLHPNHLSTGSSEALRLSLSDCYRWNMRIVSVPLGERSYDILVGRALLPGLGAACARLKLSGTCVIISDTHVAPRFAKAARNSLSRAGFDPLLIVLPAGEKSKSIKSVQLCYDRLAARRLERKSFVVALGGGVVGDLAGFVAATYLRGLMFVQVPTTLLAQVDSSVGGKVGVNLKAGKNLVGAFHQPRLVLCDLDALTSLPDREYRAGLAEVIKYGIIYDARLFAQLERDLAKLLQRDYEVLARVVARCCEIKAEIVGKDETESGVRAILNFGHTIGHALEAISGYGKYLHGEAISIGQVAAARLSARLLGLPSGDMDRIISQFRLAGLPTRVNLSAPQFHRLCAAMRLDKKVSDGEVKFVLAKEIGRVEIGRKVPLPLIRESLNRSA